VLHELSLRCTVVLSILTDHTRDTAVNDAVVALCWCGNDCRKLLRRRLLRRGLLCRRLQLHYEHPHKQRTQFITTLCCVSGVHESMTLRVRVVDHILNTLNYRMY